MSFVLLLTFEKSILSTDDKIFLFLTSFIENQNQNKEIIYHFLCQMQKFRCIFDP